MHVATVAHSSGTSAAAFADSTWRALPAPNLSALFASFDVSRWGSLVGQELMDVTPVLPLPAPGKVVCCGLNYSEHIAETGRSQPDYPTLFAKYADALLGPADDLELPLGLQIDWEAELAVVVGRPLRRVGYDEARAAIAGYTVANDISVRDWQHRTLQWFQGKSWDRSNPLGPVLVTADEIDPFVGVDVTCRINGEQVQNGNTRTLVFDCAALLAYISSFTTLRPGDVVLTGTPGGVGVARDPQRFLTDGDVLETEISGLGILRNTVRIADPATTRSSRALPTG
jgi:acylpyruvate hydrolase